MGRKRSIALVHVRPCSASSSAEGQGGRSEQVLSPQPECRPQRPLPSPGMAESVSCAPQHTGLQWQQEVSSELEHPHGRGEVCRARPAAALLGRRRSFPQGEVRGVLDASPGLDLSPGARAVVHILVTTPKHPPTPCPSDLGTCLTLFYPRARNPFHRFLISKGSFCSQ